MKRCRARDVARHAAFEMQAPPKEPSLRSLIVSRQANHDEGSLLATAASSQRGAYLSIITSVDLTIAVTVSPGLRPSRSADTRVIAATISTPAGRDNDVRHDVAELDLFHGALELIACGKHGRLLLRRVSSGSQLSTLDSRLLVSGWGGTSTLAFSSGISNIFSRRCKKRCRVPSAAIVTNVREA